MKIKIEKKYFQIGLTVFLTAIAIILAVFFIWRNESIRAFVSMMNKALAPVFYGLIIAYLLTPILNFIERRLLVPLFHRLKWFEPGRDKNRNKHIRFISIVLTIVFTATLLYFFFASIIPELIKSIQSIVTQYPVYTRNLVIWTNKLVENNPELNSILKSVVYNYSSETDNFLNDYVLPTIQKLLPNIKDMLVGISSSMFKLLSVLWNIIIGIIISLYVMSSKEQFAKSCSRLCYAILETKNANKFIESVRFTHKTFIGFFSGKIVDSIIVGFISFVILSIMKMPYTLLISLIVGVTNIIPFFGPWFGAVPSLIILLMVNPRYALYFLIFIVILQQVDGNFLGPKILSQTTGVTTFWIICSITVFSSLFRVVGMIIAVPVTAVLFTLLKNITDKLLEKKNLPTDTESYYKVGSITETGEIIPYVPAPKVKPQKDPEQETKTSKFFKKMFGSIKMFFLKLFKKNTNER
ncbi:MAG: AI-2E family transporter [Lachnospiraceae bacterium]|nr:AI-2E family transporter [Lachnospiraceae bacterium]